MREFLIQFVDQEEESDRPETGRARAADDWMGVFLRGKCAFLYATALGNFLETHRGEKMEHLERVILTDLMNLLKRSNEGQNKK